MFTSSTTLPISNSPLAARIAIFISKSFLNHSDFRQAADAAKDAFGYGEDSLLKCLLHPAALLAEIYDKHDDHPGVFEYEVAKPLGKWLAEYLAVPENEGSVDWAILVEKAESLSSTFFNFRNSLTPEETAVIAKLRQDGFAVAIWTPSELGEVAPKTIEDIVVERGNEAIDNLRR